AEEVKVEEAAPVAEPEAEKASE
ncbi:hypothetical protein EE612_048605, partial [Oryza sativa]